MLDMPNALIAYCVFLAIASFIFVVIGIKNSIKKTKIRHEWFLDEDNWGDE